MGASLVGRLAGGCGRATAVTHSKLARVSNDMLVLAAHPAPLLLPLLHSIGSSRSLSTLAPCFRPVLPLPTQPPPPSLLCGSSKASPRMYIIASHLLLALALLLLPCTVHTRSKSSTSVQWAAVARRVHMAETSSCAAGGEQQKHTLATLRTGCGTRCCPQPGAAPQAAPSCHCPPPQAPTPHLPPCAQQHVQQNGKQNGQQLASVTHRRPTWPCPWGRRSPAGQWCCRPRSPAHSANRRTNGWCMMMASGQLVARYRAHTARGPLCSMQPQQPGSPLP